MNKKLYYFTLLTFIFVLNSCYSQHNKKTKTFEGSIEYNIKLTNGDESMEDYFYDYINQKFGNITIHYFDKKGNFKREFPNSGKNGLEYYLYKSKTNNFYAKWKSIDTVFYYEASEPLTVLLDKSYGVGEMILGQSTEYIKLKSLDTIGGKKITSTYYFSGEPYTNPKLYSKIKDFNQDIAIKKAKSAFLKIDSDKFKLSEKTPLKKY